MTRAADRARCTEGQLYTMAIGVVVALALVLGGVPQALKHKSDTAGGLAGFRELHTPATGVGPPATPVTPATPAAPTFGVATPPFVANTPAPSAAVTPRDGESAPQPPAPGSINTFAQVPSPG